MNYKEINEAILNDRDINEDLVTKDDRFYKYLFNNKVAYYYAKRLSKRQTEKERWIIKRGEELNEKYYKSLDILKGICDTNNIDFSLYKTHKYIPEVVDGDIDIIVHKQDFHRFLTVFKNMGFECIEDESEKGKCIKAGYCIIEPHVNISWHSRIAVSGEHLWNDVYVHTNIYGVKNCSLLTEAQAIYGELLFSPEYLDLRTVKTIYVLSKRLADADPINKLHQLARSYKINRKYPIFLSTYKLFTSIWSELSIYQIIEVLFKNLFWKYRYHIMNKLPFTHKW